MTSMELTQANLIELLDRLGPGLTLGVDNDVLCRAFDWPAVTSPANAVKSAKRFAGNQECGFLYNAETKTGTFVRAYPRVPSSN